jgi:hypothetical protein
LVEDDADGPGDKKKEKIKIGEVKRLMVLAKPERKTIGIAIGLVSFPFSTRRCVLRQRLLIHDDASDSSAYHQRSHYPFPSVSAESSISSPETPPVYPSQSPPPQLFSPSSSPWVQQRTWEGPFS